MPRQRQIAMKDSVLFWKVLDSCFSLLLVWGLNVGTVEAGAGRRQLEAVDGEGQVLIIWIVDQETVVDRLLDALGLVAFGNKWAFSSGACASLNPGGLGKGFVVGLDVVDNDPPVTVDVDGSEGLDVCGVSGTEVRLLDDLVQAVDTVVGVGKDVLVHLLDGIVVVFEGLLDLIGGVLLILKTPWSGVSMGTSRGAIHWRGTVCGLSSVCWWWGCSVWWGDGGVWWRGWAVAVWWGSGCVRRRSVGCGGVWGWGVRSGCVRWWGWKVCVGWSTGSYDCHKSRENHKAIHY